ncbi:MAG: CRTAC1 family protein [Acidobacteria bacterium]|nr:CRTAC1 family protein [Acidobacteriota bacterium]
MRLNARQVMMAIVLAPALAGGCNRNASTETAPKSAPQAAATSPAEPATSATNASAASETSTSAGGARPSGPIEFVDVTTQAGIHFKHNTGAFGKKYLPETMGSGVCVIDYDNDGWPDIFFVNSMDWPGHKTGKSYPALYHNNHDGTFTDVTRQAGLAIESYGLGCAVGDYDNDGFADLYVTTVGSNHLFHNLGNGKFADVTDKAGVASPGFSASAVWVDYDNDGKLDLFVTHYIDWSVEKDQYCTLDNKNKSYCTPQTYKGETSRLYRNKGNGIFEDVTKKAGLFDPTGKALGVALLDYDNDGWIDLFVTNDTEPNKLYHNNHDGTFTDVGVTTGVAFSESGRVRAGMGTDAGDFDGSGFPGLIIGNFTNESMALYRNDGSGLFSDESMRSGLGQATNQALTFGCSFVDYDLDGNLDVVAANGHVSDDIAVVQPTVRYAQPIGIFRNLGKGKFEDVSGKLGKAIQKPVVGRGIAYADFFGDGALDLVATTNNGPARLLRNLNANQNDVLRVKLMGTKSNRDAIGAKVTMTTNTGAAETRVVKGGSSYLSQSELTLTFGLGKAGGVKSARLQIVWPSGQKETLADVKTNQVVTVKEGKGIISSAPIHFTATPIR